MYKYSFQKKKGVEDEKNRELKKIEK